MELVDGYIANQYGFVNRTQGIAFYGQAGFKRRVRDGDLVRELHGFYSAQGFGFPAWVRTMCGSLA